MVRVSCLKLSGLFILVLLFLTSHSFAMGGQPKKVNTALYVGLVTDFGAAGRAQFLLAKEQIISAMDSLLELEPNQKLKVKVRHAPLPLVPSIVSSIGANGTGSEIEGLASALLRGATNNALLYGPRLALGLSKSITVTLTTTNVPLTVNGREGQVAGAAMPMFSALLFNAANFATFKSYVKTRGTSWANIEVPANVVIHEIGHNLGLGHGNDGTEDLGFIKDYGRGYMVGEDIRDAPANLATKCTIMRYCLATPEGRSNDFSSPNKIFQDGVRQGTGDINRDRLIDPNGPYRDSARALVETSLKWQGKFFWNIF